MSPAIDAPPLAADDDARPESAALGAVRSAAAEERPKALVIGAPLGTGHLSAARYVAAHLADTRGSAWDVRYRDAATAISPRFGAFVERSYRCAVATPWSLQQRLAYLAFDQWPSPISRLIAWPVRARASRWLRSERPAVVISTLHILTAISRELLPRSVPVVSVVTDAGRVTRAWFTSAADYYVFSDHTAASYARACGVPPARIAVSPIVLEEPAHIVTHPESQRQRLALPPGFTVLVAAGGVGYGPNALRFIRRVVAEDVCPNLLIAPGRNSRLAREMTIAAGGRGRLVPSGSSLQKWVRAADLVVGKAGWLSLSEASVIRRPTLIVDAIPGQESENLRVAVESGIARAMDVESAVALTLAYARGRAALAADFSSANWSQGLPSIGRSAYTDLLDQMVPGVRSERRRSEREAARFEYGCPIHTPGLP